MDTVLKDSTVFLRPSPVAPTLLRVPYWPDPNWFSIERGRYWGVLHAGHEKDGCQSQLGLQARAKESESTNYLV